ncbi:peptidoglycan-binding domain-containing protein [Actinomadura mexicana]|uniref:Putative peptidoglycan binding domain-containing protein n=1 Tax=Actinomadura mexicana TaxID=134959 RepID=A0A239BF64_9ACTN|nr:peptidoglycan-binding domain-containing protein [Actinomadura mexicana]SNS06707.1 Putative peptidoglycan binding domain-containing protein [Actinomadura mexicana]
MGETIAERAPAEREGRRARRRRPRLRIALAVAAVVAAGGGATVAALAAGGDGGGGRAANLPPGTAKVARETLSDTQSEDGRLGYGPTLTATNQARGTITWLPESGDEIDRGRRLYELDGDPVVLMYGSEPSYRPLRTGTEGSDVKRFETNLAALGYDGFTVDDEYTSGTAEAVREWQDDIGAPETGTVEVGRVAYAGGPVRVETVEADPGEPAAPGKKILGYTGTTQAVTVELDTADQRLARKGAEVEVTLPEGRPVTAEIDEVTTVIEPGEQGEDPATKVEVTIWLDSAAARKAAARYALASADVRFTAGRRENVLTVPVSALVALREGGFGVEVVKGGASSYVPVETGLFADGKVEVSGQGIAEGALVGVPK